MTSQTDTNMSYELYWTHADGSELPMGSYDDTTDVDRRDIERDCWTEILAQCGRACERAHILEGRLVWVDTIHGDHVEGAHFLDFSDLSA